MKLYRFFTNTCRTIALAIYLLTGLAITSFTQQTWKKTTEELIVANPPFKECHASSIVDLGSGELMATWFGGTREGHKDVVIWATRFSKGKWSTPVQMGDGIMNDTLRYPTWNPVLFKEKKGTLYLFYKVGPSPREWWGMVRTSKNNGKTWSAPVRLPDGILGPIKNKPVQLKDGSILSPSSTESRERGWRAHIERSTDGGKTWSFIPVDTANAFDVIQPSVLQYADGSLQVLCRSKQKNVMEAWSFDNGKTWGALTRTSLPNPNSGTDAVTLRNGTQLIVYNPTIPGKGGRAKLNVAASTNGKTWTDIAILENGTDEEYSYPAIIQAKDGKVHITYTYDRKNVKHIILEGRN